MGKAAYKFYPKVRILKDGTKVPYLTCRFYFPFDDPRQKTKDVPTVYGHDERAAEKWFLDEFRPSLARAVPKVKRDAEEKMPTSGATFEWFARQWTSGKLHEKYPDHVRAKDSTRDESALRLYINPQIGPKPLGAITLDDAERVMSALPKEMKRRTRKLVAQVMRKVLSYAVYPGRYIAANPIPEEWMPKTTKRDDRAKSYLFPDEDAALVKCRDIPIERRLAYGILAREGLRAGELSSLRWRDLDLERGRIRLDENKTDDPRAWALRDDVVHVLAWWKKQRHAAPDDLVIGLDLQEGSRWLRGDPDRPKTAHGDLGRAGITRAELFEDSKKRQPIRLHDLRATFCTIALSSGKTEQWVCDRTGWRSSQMVARYHRQAREWGELGLGDLRPMDRLIPEMKKRTKAA